MYKKAKDILLPAFLLLFQLLPFDGSSAGEWPIFERVQAEVERRGLDGEQAEIELSAAEGLLKSVDPLAAIMSESEMQAFEGARTGLVSSVGILVEKDGAHFAVADRIDMDCPLEAGDVLLAVDGVPTDESDLFGIHEQLRGEKGSSVELVVSNAGSRASSTAMVARADWHLPPLIGSEILPGGIRYLRLRGFYAPFDDARESIASALAGEASGIVIDLRAAGGDSLAAVLATADLFMPARSNLLAYTELADGSEHMHGLESPQMSTLPLIVLQDRDTTAAAEVFSAACRSGSAKALLVGEESRGDPLLREFTTIAADSRMYLLARRLESADGTVYDGMSGVKPDIAVASDSHLDWSAGAVQERYYRRKTAEGEELNRKLAERIGDDAILRRAVDILIGLKALGLD